MSKNIDICWKIVLQISVSFIYANKDCTVKSLIYDALNPQT